MCFVFAKNKEKIKMSKKVNVHAVNSTHQYKSARNL